jgi:hypothetical protein
VIIIVDLMFPREEIDSAARYAVQEKKRLLDLYFRKKNPGTVFGGSSMHAIEEDKVPFVYLAGGMVASMPLFTKGARTENRSWQYEFIEKTGGKVYGDQGRFAVIPAVEHGNAVLLNPIDHGASSRKVFTVDDYVNLLISQGSIVFFEGGFNRQGNPGYATMAEIVAQFAKGGLNILCNQKGYAAAEPSLVDEDTRFFEAFVTDPSCLVKSLDDAAGMVNDVKSMNALIRDANEMHKSYVSTVQERPAVFIGGSVNDRWAFDASQFLKGYGVESVLAQDIVDPMDDPISYLRLMDGCALSFIYHSAAINSSNRLLPLAQSAYAVMTGKTTIYVSEPLLIMEGLEEQFPELGSKKRVIVPQEKVRDSKLRSQAKRKYDSLRYQGPDFIPDAPHTFAYTSNHMIPALNDTVQLMQLYRG